MRLEENKMKITIGSQTLGVMLVENQAVAKLKSLLPLKLTMTELNGNEKYFQLSTYLPTESIRPGTIQNGDLMLYESNSIVLTYKTFSTFYSYTRLGRIDDPSGLAAAVGTWEVAVLLELQSRARVVFLAKISRGNACKKSCVQTREKGRFGRAESIFFPPWPF